MSVCLYCPLLGSISKIVTKGALYLEPLSWCALFREVQRVSFRLSLVMSGAVAVDLPKGGFSFDLCAR